MQHVSALPLPRPYLGLGRCRSLFIEDAVACRGGKNIIPPHVGLGLLESGQNVIRRQSACELKGNTGQCFSREQLQETVESHVLTYFPPNSIKELGETLMSQGKGQLIDLSIVPIKCSMMRVSAGHYALVQAWPLSLGNCASVGCLHDHVPSGYRLLRLREGIFFLVASLQLRSEFHPNGWTYFENGWLAKVDFPSGNVHLRRWSETQPLSKDVDPESVAIAVALI